MIVVAYQGTVKLGFRASRYSRVRWGWYAGELLGVMPNPGGALFASSPAQISQLFADGHVTKVQTEAELKKTSPAARLPRAAGYGPASELWQAADGQAVVEAELKGGKVEVKKEKPDSIEPSTGPGEIGAGERGRP